LSDFTKIAIKHIVRQATKRMAATALTHQRSFLWLGFRPRALKRRLERILLGLPTLLMFAQSRRAFLGKPRLLPSIEAIFARGVFVSIVRHGTTQITIPSSANMTAIANKSPRRCLRLYIGQPHISCGWPAPALHNVEHKIVAPTQLHALRDVVGVNENVFAAVCCRNEAIAF